LVLGKLKLHI